MADQMTNDNEAADDKVVPSASGRGSGQHGLAAILLVESLIHGLVARSVISVADAVEIVNTAAEVEEVIAYDTEYGMVPQPMARTLIGAIGASLSLDLPEALSEEGNQD